MGWHSDSSACGALSDLQMGRPTRSSAILLSACLSLNSSSKEARLAGIAVGVGFVLYLPCCACALREALAMPRSSKDSGAHGEMHNRSLRLKR